MNEMYWITRLDDISIALMLLMLGLVVIGIILFFNYLTDRGLKKDKKVIKRCFIASVILLLICAFIPSEEDMYKIIGIGGTYEYLKDNKDIKDIPDNTIKALKIWSENLLKEQEEKEDILNNKNK